MIHVVISHRPKHPCPPGEYHYPKLQGADLLKQAFAKCADIGNVLELYDFDRDVVAFDVRAGSVEMIKDIVSNVLGSGHDLMIYDPYARCPLLGVSESPKP